MPTPAQPKERSTEPPCCPRCGYDQSGEPATWRTSCPLGGQCPECGHAFRWADLFNERRRDHRWYVEHAPGAHGFLLRYLPSFVMIVSPPRYWRRLGVDGRVQLAPLLLFVLLWAFVLHLMSMGAVAWFNSTQRWHDAVEWYPIIRAWELPWRRVAPVQNGLDFDAPEH